MIVAWHEEPGKPPSKEPSHRVRYDRAHQIPEVFLVEFRHSNHRIGAHNLHESHRTLREAPLGRRCPRHFVPGYDHTVPPGHFFKHAVELLKCGGA
jgi:hypothetical protein